MLDARKDHRTSANSAQSFAWSLRSRYHARFLLSVLQQLAERTRRPRVRSVLLVAASSTWQRLRFLLSLTLFRSWHHRRWTRQIFLQATFPQRYNRHHHSAVFGAIH